MDTELNQKLYAKSLKLLGYRAYSETELREKLTRHGEAREVDRVIEKLKTLNLINDLEFARNFLAYRVKTKLIGRIRAERDLMQRQVPRQIAKKALDEIFEEMDETKILESAVEKWLSRMGKPQKPKELKRLYNYLERQGFQYGMVYGTLERYRNNLSMESSQTDDVE